MFSLIQAFIFRHESVPQKRLLYSNIMFRHGDRAPNERAYPNDVYDESYWPNGYGELTEVRKNSNLIIEQKKTSHLKTVCVFSWDLNKAKQSDVISGIATQLRENSFQRIMWKVRYTNSKKYEPKIR